MVDFSDGEASERWFAGIEPVKRQHEVAVALAARAALRVAPLLSAELSRRRPRAATLTNLVLPSLRAAASAWAVARYPVHRDVLRAPALSAIRAARYSTTAGAASAARAVYRSAARAALVAAHHSAPRPARAALAALRNAFSATAITVSAAMMDDAAAQDAAFVDSGSSGDELAGLPLWPAGMPEWALDNWQVLKSALLDAGEGWDVWTEWYEARIAGNADAPNEALEEMGLAGDADVPNEALEIARATIPDEVWKQGPAVVNAEIKRLIAEHEGNAQDTNSVREQRDFEPILATRAALRALPLFVTDTERMGGQAKSRFLLSVFRALAVAWARTEYSSSVSPKWSVAAAREVSHHMKGSGTTALDVGGAAAAAAFAAGSVNDKVVLSRALGARTSAMRAMAFVYVAGGDIALNAHRSDESDIVPGVRPDQIAQIELWSGRNPPEFIVQPWETLKEQLRIADEDWDVWIDWYEARLDGQLRRREIELAFVNYIQNVPATAPASVANSEIKRLIEIAEPNLIEPLLVSDTLEALILPSIENIPEQESTGTHFGLDAQGRIDVVRIPPATDDLQRFHYDEMRHKAQQLVGLGQMLGDIASAVTRILEALPEQMEDASVDKLWSRGNTLRRRHDAHVRTVDDKLGPDPARLDTLVAANLVDFIDTFNVYAIGDPRLLELDRIRLGPQDREAARKLIDLAEPIARAVAEPESPVTPGAQETLAEQVSAATDAPNDINGDQAAELAQRTTGNFVSELLRRAYAPIRKVGAFAKSEAKFAQKEIRAGAYRTVGAAVVIHWPEISSFVVRNADALRAFVTEAYQNPKLVEIINLIVRAAGH
jgi:hypothetical protein